MAKKTYNIDKFMVDLELTLDKINSLMLTCPPSVEAKMVLENDGRSLSIKITALLRTEYEPGTTKKIGET